MGPGCCGLFRSKQQGDKAGSGSGRGHGAQPTQTPHTYQHGPHAYTPPHTPAYGAIVAYPLPFAAAEHQRRFQDDDAAGDDSSQSHMAEAGDGGNAMEQLMLPVAGHNLGPRAAPAAPLPPPAMLPLLPPHPPRQNGSANNMSVPSLPTPAQSARSVLKASDVMSPAPARSDASQVTGANASSAASGEVAAAGPAAAAAAAADGHHGADDEARQASSVPTAVEPVWEVELGEIGRTGRTGQAVAHHLQAVGLWACWRIRPKDLVLAERIGNNSFGGGGSGGVFRGIWRGTQVAVKLIGLDDFEQYSSEVARCVDGVDMMCQLRHPNIIRLMGLALLRPGGPGSPAALAIVTEFASQGCLLRFMRSGAAGPGPRLTPRARLGIAKDVAKACAYLHGQRQGAIVHSDLNSIRVMLELEGQGGFRAKLNSFGHSWQLGCTRRRLLWEDNLVSTSHTSISNYFLHSAWRWTAPEAILSVEPSEKCDEYSYGCLLYELVTGCVPWQGQPYSIDLLVRVLQKGERPELPEELDTQVRSLISACWAQDPRARPTFQQVLQELRAMTELAAVTDSDLQRRAAPAADGVAGQPGTAAGGGEAGADEALGAGQPPTAPYWSRLMPSAPVWDFRIEPEDLVVRKLLGSGAFGAVHRGLWHSTPVAVKLQSVEGMEPGQVARCKEEISLMCQLHHPNIVQLLGAAELPAPPRVAIVMELVTHGKEPSASLYALLRSPRVELTPARRHGVAADIAKGMAYLHAKRPVPVLHRDLKSLNVLVNKSWRAKPLLQLCDFGLSKTKVVSALTAGHSATMRWMAPEYVMGKACNEASDVYSFGCVLYELATGAVPWPHLELDVQVWYQITVERQPLPLPPGLDPPLHRLIERCCAIDPAARPGFGAILEALAGMRELRPVGLSSSEVAPGDAATAAGQAEPAAAYGASLPEVQPPALTVAQVAPPAAQAAQAVKQAAPLLEVQQPLPGPLQAANGHAPHEAVAAEGQGPNRQRQHQQ